MSLLKRLLARVLPQPHKVKPPARFFFLIYNLFNFLQSRPELPLNKWLRNLCLRSLNSGNWTNRTALTHPQGKPKYIPPPYKQVSIFFTVDGILRKSFLTGSNCLTELFEYYLNRS